MGVTDGDASDRVVAGAVWVTRGTVNEQDPDRPGGPGAIQDRGHNRSKTMNTYGRSLPTTRALSTIRDRPFCVLGFSPIWARSYEA